MSSTTPAGALDAVTRSVDYIRVAVGSTEGADSATWIRASEFVGAPTTLYEVMSTSMRGRGIARDDIGMSLLVQSYAFRIASLAIGTWLISGGVINVHPGNVSIGFGRNRPNAVLLDRVEWAVSPPAAAEDCESTLAGLHRHLVDDHLAGLIETARRATTLGRRLLWSNVASSCASSFGAFMEPLRDQRRSIRRRAQQFFATGCADLSGGGVIVAIGETWAWQRHACCLSYQQADGAKCGDCSLFSAAERSERCARILAESTTGRQR